MNLPAYDWVNLNRTLSKLGAFEGDDAGLSCGTHDFVCFGHELTWMQHSDQIASVRRAGAATDSEAYITVLLAKEMDEVWPLYASSKKSD